MQQLSGKTQLQTSSPTIQIMIHALLDEQELPADFEEFLKASIMNP